MFYERIKTKPTPDWVLTANRSVDVTDIWRDTFTDQDDVRATAYLVGNPFDDGMEVTGIVTESDAGRDYWERDRLIRVAGVDMIYQMEQYEMASSYSDRTCRECNGKGFVVYEPVNPGGNWVSERCRCQPKPIETDAEFYTRRIAERNEAADRLMMQREAR